MFLILASSFVGAYDQGGWLPLFKGCRSIVLFEVRIVGLRQMAGLDPVSASRLVVPIARTIATWALLNYSRWVRVLGG